MSWSQSLIKLATYEVEVLQKRLAQIVDRRSAAELKLVVLEAEGEAEMARPSEDPMAGLYRAAFVEALSARKAAVRADIAAIRLEEQGARDALAEAFEAQKKYEHVAEQARLVESRAVARRETAMFDEMGLRKASR